MSNDLTLKQTHASGPLLPSRFTQAFARPAKISPDTQAPVSTPRGVMYGQELRLALALQLDDAACAAFLLDFGGQGLRVKGVAHGPSAKLLAWAFHALAASLKCTLFDANLSQEVEAKPEAYREAAVAYLSSYEADIRLARKTRKSRGGDEADEGGAFLAWLVREEHIAVIEEAGALGTALPMHDPPALYEMLLASDAVEDVFVSERELASLLTRFHARMTPQR